MEIEILDNVKAILFDLDNTLIDTKGADRIACDKVCRYLEDRGIKKSSAQDAVQRFYESVRASPQDPVEGRTDVDVWRTRLWSKALATKLSSHSERAYALWKVERMRHLGFSRSVAAMLVRLRENGYQLGLITNGPSAAQREKMHRIEAHKYFQVVLISGDYDRPKPDPFLFDLALECLGVDSSQCLMVGDKMETDIEGGINAGLQATFLISPKDNRLWDDEELKPDYIIKRVCDIMDYLPAMAAPLPVPLAPTTTKTVLPSSPELLLSTTSPLSLLLNAGSSSSSNSSSSSSTNAAILKGNASSASTVVATVATMTKVMPSSSSSSSEENLAACNRKTSSANIEHVVAGLFR